MIRVPHQINFLATERYWYRLAVQGKAAPFWHDYCDFIISRRVSERLQESWPPLSDLLLEQGDGVEYIILHTVLPRIIMITPLLIAQAGKFEVLVSMHQAFRSVWNKS